MYLGKMVEIATGRSCLPTLFIRIPGLCSRRCPSLIRRKRRKRSEGIVGGDCAKYAFRMSLPPCDALTAGSAWDGKMELEAAVPRKHT